MQKDNEESGAPWTNRFTHHHHFRILSWPTGRVDDDDNLKPLLHFHLLLLLLLLFLFVWSAEGDAKITEAYNLPCRYVLHTVGPICQHKKVQEEQERQLRDCYWKCLDLAAQHSIRFGFFQKEFPNGNQRRNSFFHLVSMQEMNPNVSLLQKNTLFLLFLSFFSFFFFHLSHRSIAFCCISTGMFGYPQEPAAHVAMVSCQHNCVFAMKRCLTNNLLFLWWLFQKTVRMALCRWQLQQNGLNCV